MLSFFNRIVNKWIGKKVDYDGAYGYQCVDFIKQYCKETGFPVTTSGNAIDLWKIGLGPSYKKVVNTANAIPTKGDVVIFSGPSKYGHICIADEFCTDKVLRVIEQNAGTGNGDGKGNNAIKKSTYNYINPKCLGWYTRK